jgi:Spy/CpxP family protein refolding chaperone
MTLRLIGIGTTVVAAALTTALVTAQTSTSDSRAGAPAVGADSRADQQPQGGPGRGMGMGPQGRFGRGQGIGPRGPLGPAGPGQMRRAGPGQMGRGGRGMMGFGGPPAGIGGRRGGGSGVGGGLAALDLTEAQRATITDLHRDSRDRAIPLQDELASARKALHRAVFADTRDAAHIASLTTKIASLEKQLTDLHVKTATAVADALTAEQRETIRLRDGRGRFGPGAGRGRGPGR